MSYIKFTNTFNLPKDLLYLIWSFAEPSQFEKNMVVLFFVKPPKREKIVLQKYDFYSNNYVKRIEIDAFVLCAS